MREILEKVRVLEAQLSPQELLELRTFNLQSRGTVASYLARLTQKVASLSRKNILVLHDMDSTGHSSERQIEFESCPEPGDTIIYPVGEGGEFFLFSVVEVERSARSVIDVWGHPATE